MMIESPVVTNVISSLPVAGSHGPGLLPAATLAQSTSETLRASAVSLRILGFMIVPQNALLTCNDHTRPSETLW